MYHQGKCRNLHGHTYRLEVEVQGPIIAPQANVSDGGMVRDFGEISDIVKPMIEMYFDHKHLNDSLQMTQPTAELMAAWIFQWIASYNIPVIEVRLWETPTSWVIVDASDARQVRTYFDIQHQLYRESQKPKIVSINGNIEEPAPVV